MIRARRASCLLAGILALGATACEQAIQVRGNLPEQDIVGRIQPGVHSREDVARLLGSPSTISTFQDSKWYYIGQKTTEFAFFEPEILERKVLVVAFDDGGTVVETQQIGLADSQEIDPVDRETPTEGRELSFFQQIFGNIGRFTASDEER